MCTYAPLANLLDDFVVADGLSDHEVPLDVMQLRLMLRREAAKDNGNRQRSGIMLQPSPKRGLL